ncbi:MAG: Rieske 2Fe-2S domain-containing protein [Chloroflexi bacterium]|nr:Rieske 2Fe-2S domain-containing protein [Chloroflexota bacterium]
MPGFDNAEEEALVRVGPGTPSGELFRRYWLPVEASENLQIGDAQHSINGPRNPLQVRVLGEELVLWRDGSGQAHLMDEHCAHRGTSLYWGRVEPDRIRCLYHAWAYDGTGQCVEQPAEPPDSTFKNHIRQQTYPTCEVGGLIFAYMGPPDKQPCFPRYDILFRDDGLRITGKGGYIQGCNVFQALLDNNLDIWHPEFAHNWFMRREAIVSMHHGIDGRPASPVRYDRTPWGTRDMVLKDTAQPGVYEYYELHTVFPAARCNRNALRWGIPVDDYRTRWFVVEFYEYGPDGKLTPDSERAANNRGPTSMTHATAEPADNWVRDVGAWWNFDHRMRGGVLWEDEVICGTQGTEARHGLPDWEKWHLGSSDRGVVLQRRVWREQIERIEQGLDPVGIERDPRKAADLIRIPAERIITNWEHGNALMQMSAEERAASMSSSSGSRVYSLTTR